MRNLQKASDRPPLRLDQRKFRASAAAMIVAMLVGATLLPLTSPQRFPSLPMCLLKSATGLPCPFCGGTRATQAILRGDFARALHLNAAALPAVITLVTAALVLGWEAMRGRAIGDWDAQFRRLRSLLPLLATLLCVYWLVHLMDALRAPKSELVDLRNPIAHAIHECFLGRAE